MQGVRRQARAYALQLLYQLEINTDDSVPSLDAFWKGAEASDQAKSFAQPLVDTTRRALEEIDPALEAVMDNWKLNRLSVVIRSLLRLAYAEMMLLGETPPAVVINEAIELARDFGDEESAKFVNGVLDKLAKSLPEQS